MRREKVASRIPLVIASSFPALRMKLRGYEDSISKNVLGFIDEYSPWLLRSALNLLETGVLSDEETRIQRIFNYLVTRVNDIVEGNKKPIRLFCELLMETSFYLNLISWSIEKTKMRREEVIVDLYGGPGVASEYIALRFKYPALVFEDDEVFLEMIFERRLRTGLNIIPIKSSIEKISDHIDRPVRLLVFMSPSSWKIDPKVIVKKAAEILEPKGVLAGILPLDEHPAIKPYLTLLSASPMPKTSEFASLLENEGFRGIRIRTIDPFSAFYSFKK